MASENAHNPELDGTESTSENTDRVLASYRRELATAPLAAETVRTYTSKVRAYLIWLAATDLDGNPLTDPRTRDWAVRDYRTHLITVAKRAPTTINNALAAIDDFYTRRGLGPAADRLSLPRTAPRALEHKPALRWLRAIQAHPATASSRCCRSAPDCGSPKPCVSTSTTCGYPPAKAYCGCTAKATSSARSRSIPNCAPNCSSGSTNAPTGPPPQPNPHYCHRGARLTTRGASTVFHTIVDHAALDDDITAHTGRHTFATTLIRGGTDLIVVADLLGHQRLESVRAYTQPTAADRAKAVNLLPTDR